MVRVLGVVAVTHRIPKRLRVALDRFCEKHGLKQQAVIEAAVEAWLEDAQDLALIEERRSGPWVEWKDVRDDL